MLLMPQSQDTAKSAIGHFTEASIKTMSSGKSCSVSRWIMLSNSAQKVVPLSYLEKGYEAY